MTNFREWLLLQEGQAEEQALKILGYDKDKLDQIKQITPSNKYLPLLAYFYDQANITVLNEYIRKYHQLVSNNAI